MRAISLPASYGVNYTLGDIGFQFVDNSFLSEGIVFFTGWEAMSDIKVSHSFVITGQNECIESLSNGVDQSTLAERFASSHTHVTIRRPVDLTLQRGMDIVKRATSLLGTPYDFRLLAGMIAANSRLVRWLPTVIYMAYRRKVCWYAHTEGQLICDGLCVKALNAVPEYAAALPEEYYVYDPQMLFEDTVVFKPWKKTL